MAMTTKDARNMSNDICINADDAEFVVFASTTASATTGSSDGFRRRATTKPIHRSTSVIEESNEDLVETMFEFFAQLQKEREPSNTKKSATFLRTTNHQTVYINVIFQRMGDIDTASESFSASVSIQAKWREPNFDGEFTLKPTQITWRDYWNPELYIGNFLGNLEKDDVITRDLMFNGNEAYVIENHELTGHFHEKLELQRFPFDIQKFKVVILSKLSTSDVTLVADEDQWKTSMNTESFANKQEWRLYSHVSLDAEDEDELPTKGLPISVASQNKPQLLATTVASRKYFYYVMNYMFTMFVSACMGLCTFAIHHEESHGRLKMTAILLLEILWFKRDLNALLPRYSYVTILDVYILTSVGMVSVIFMWHSIAGYWAHHEITAWVDRGVLIFFGSFYVIFQVVYIFIFIHVKMGRNYLVQRENNYVKKIISAAENADNVANENGDGTEYLGTTQQSTSL